MQVVLVVIGGEEQLNHIHERFLKNQARKIRLMDGMLIGSAFGDSCRLCLCFHVGWPVVWSGYEYWLIARQPRSRAAA